MDFRVYHTTILSLNCFYSNAVHFTHRIKTRPSNPNVSIIVYITTKVPNTALEIKKKVTKRVILIIISDVVGTFISKRAVCEALATSSPSVKHLQAQG